MKAIKVTTAGLFALLLTGCSTMGTNFGTGIGQSSQSSSVLTDVFGAVTNGEAIGNVLSSVIGLDKLSARQLVASWKYDGPGCAFTSQSALARAGGEIAATQVEEKLAAQYAALGLSAGNTFITFNADGTYSGRIGGKQLSGKYTYDEKTGAVKLSSLLFSLNGYVKRNTSGMSLLFESKKILPVLQTIASISGNSSLQTIGEISKNYDGVRIGFDMRK